MNGCGPRKDPSIADLHLEYSRNLATMNHCSNQRKDWLLQLPVTGNGSLGEVWSQKSQGPVRHLETVLHRYSGGPWKQTDQSWNGVTSSYFQYCSFQKLEEKIKAQDLFCSRNFTLLRADFFRTETSKGYSALPRPTSK